MALRGKLGVDVMFADSTTASGVSSLKTISMQSAQEYTTGKVVVATGTAGTAAVTVAVAPSSYRDAAGGLVALASVAWYAFQSSGAARCDEVAGTGVAASSGGMVAVSVATGGTSGFSVYTGSGTATYTLVAYGT